MFANIKHPELKEKFPQWSDRVKRINNLWRRLDSNERDYFVKKARENRADVPKRRNKRTASLINNHNAPDDFGEASQDSNHSHLDQNNEQRNEQRRNSMMPPEGRLNFVQNAEQVPRIKLLSTTPLFRQFIQTLFIQVLLLHPTRL